MAALLTLDVLRALDTPGDFVRPTAPDRGRGPRRPVLLARWTLGPNGRPMICGWIQEFPPPD